MFLSKAIMGAEDLPPAWSPSTEVKAHPQDHSKSGRTLEIFYRYKDRDHRPKEIAKDLGIIYGLTWMLYPLTQPETVREKGSWVRYRHNFGQIVFDQDEPFWNWFVHPISGSQLFLYYRARGYSRSSALGLAFISSTLFEFTVEIYTEPASAQDLYQTPILGAVLGVGIEYTSLALLNSGNPLGIFFGHLINPCTLFPFFEEKTFLTPTVFQNKAPGLIFVGEF
ncbi:MAG: DUF3943 domain-containing protein [Bdellovibrio sp.]|nr:DUF3943 domain-containing protein [Bdellovibrio sp.]